MNDPGVVASDVVPRVPSDSIYIVGSGAITNWQFLSGVIKPCLQTTRSVRTTASYILLKRTLYLAPTCMIHNDNKKPAALPGQVKRCRARQPTV